MNFLTNSKLTRVEPAAAAGQTLLTSSVIDMKSFDGVTFIAFLGDVLDTAVLTLQAQQGDQSDGSDATNLAGVLATFTADATSADNNMLALEVARPTKRFLRVTLTRATANAAVDGIVAVQSNPAEAPVVQDASVLATKFALSPV